MARRYLPSLAGIAVALGLLLAPLVAAEAAAGPPQDITLSPSSTQLSAPPGGTTTGSITVINSGSAAFNIKAYASPYHVANITYDPSFTLIPGKTDPSAWVHFKAATTAAVAPNQSVVMPYSLVVPAGTAPGGYYAVVFAETEPNPGAGVTSHSRVGNILYITVQGPVVQQGAIKAVPHSHFIFGTTVPLATEVEDSGGLHFVTTAHLSLNNYLSGKAAYSAALQRYVLPQTIRKISAVAAPTAVIGLYKVEASADILGKTQTLPSQWVVVVHPAALWAIPVIVVLVVVYFLLPKKRKEL